MNSDSPPLTPTKSELDTFQVLSNSHFVDFKKNKPNSRLFKESLSPKAPNSTPNDNDEQELANIQEEEENAENDFALPFRPLPTLNQEENLEIATDKILTPKIDFVDSSNEKKEEFFEQMPSMNFLNLPPNKFESHSPYISPHISPKVSPRIKKKFIDDNESVNTEILLEIESEKEALLQELSFLESQGSYVPVKKLTMKDKLEEIQFQYDKVQSEINTSQGVEMVKSGIKMGSVVLEFGLKKLGIPLVEGFSTNLNKDSHKFNRPLTKLYKKYWRKGSSSPEMELAMIVLGSLAWTMIQNKMQGTGSRETSSFLPNLSHLNAPSPPPPPMPPKVNLMQFQKEKDLQNKIDELEKKLEFLQSDASPPHVIPETKVNSPVKKVNLNSKTNSISSQLSSLKKNKTQIKL